MTIDDYAKEGNEGVFNELQERLNSCHFENMLITVIDNIYQGNNHMQLRYAKSAMADLANFKGHCKTYNHAVDFVKLVIKRCNDNGFY
jgi:hypothetical protein